MKTYKELKHEFGSKFNIAYVHDKGFAFLGAKICDWFLKEIEQRDFENRTDALRTANTLIKIAGNTSDVTPEFKQTTTMVVRALQEEDGLKYVRHLENRISELEDELKSKQDSPPGQEFNPLVGDNGRWK